MTSNRKISRCNTGTRTHLVARPMFFSGHRWHRGRCYDSTWLLTALSMIYDRTTRNARSADVNLARRLTAQVRTVLGVSANIHKYSVLKPLEDYGMNYLFGASEQSLNSQLDMSIETSDRMLNSYKTQMKPLHAADRTSKSRNPNVTKNTRNPV